MLGLRLPYLVIVSFYYVVALLQLLQEHNLFYQCVLGLLVGLIVQVNNFQGVSVLILSCIDINSEEAQLVNLIFRHFKCR